MKNRRNLCFSIMFIYILSACLPIASTETAVSQQSPSDEVISISTATSVIPLPILEGSPMNMANSVPPTDILTEVQYFAGGGGPDPICSKEISPTLVNLDLTTRTTNYGETHIFSCGWNVNDIIDIKIIRPDGKEFTERQKAVSHKDLLGYEPDTGVLVFSFYIGAGDPIGTYQILVTRKEYTYFQLALWLTPPEYPIIDYWDFFNRKDHINMRGFAAQENIRLFEYDCSSITINLTCYFVEWKYIVADEIGSAIIPTAEHDHDFVAIGDQSGLAKNVSSGIGVPILCGNGVPSDLSLSARPSIDHDIYIYDTPGTNPQLVTGVKFTGAVIDGPVCYQNEIWWKIQSEYGQIAEGWAPESTVIQNTVIKTPAPICGDLPSRLSVRKYATVAFTDGLNLKVHLQPGLLQPVSSEISEGTGFTIVGGPQCVDNIVWWQIAVNNLVEGWVAEFHNGKYLLDPSP